MTISTIDEINAVLEPETGWRVELAISEHDQSEFLRLYRKDGDTWDNKVFVWSLPRESSVGVLVACGGVAGHYYKLGIASASDVTMESVPSALIGDGDEHALSDEEIAEFEAQIRRDRETNIRVTHFYDIGNQDVYVKRFDGTVDGKRAALYCQFQCESWFGSDAMLSNLAIAALLCMFYGYRHRAADGPVSECSTTVDMYSDREVACGTTYLELLNDASLHRAGMREVMVTLFERA